MEKGNLGSYAMKLVAAGAHIPTPWLFEPAKCPDDRADYCLGEKNDSKIAPIKTFEMLSTAESDIILLRFA